MISTKLVLLFEKLCHDIFTELQAIYVADMTEYFTLSAGNPR